MNGSSLASLGANGIAVTPFPAGEEFTPVWKEILSTRPCMVFGSFGERAFGEAG